MLLSEYSIYLADAALSSVQLESIRTSLLPALQGKADPFAVGYDQGLNLAFLCLSGNLRDTSEFEDHLVALPVNIRVPDTDRPGGSLRLAADTCLTGRQAEHIVALITSLARPTWHVRTVRASLPGLVGELRFWDGRSIALADVVAAFSAAPCARIAAQGHSAVGS